MREIRIPRALREVGVYGLITGLNRGAQLLYLPLLTAGYSLAQIGQYGLGITLALLAAPILTLNLASAVIREGIEDLDWTTGISIRALVLATGPALIFAVTAVATRGVGSFISAILCFAVTEGLFAIVTSEFRLRRRVWPLFSTTALRVALNGVFFPIWSGDERAVSLLLVSQAGVTLALAIAGQMFVRREGEYDRGRTRPAVADSLRLIPHGIAQWISSGSDRMVVELFRGSAELGIYNIAYSIASILGIVNAGIALALPPIILATHDTWVRGADRTRGIRLYQAVAVITVLSVMLTLEMDRMWFGFLRHYDPRIPLIVGLVGGGLTCLGHYYFYGNTLLFKREMTALSVQSAIAAAGNLVLSLLLVSRMGIVGVGIATLLTYAGYLTLVVRSALKLEPDYDRRAVMKELAGLPVVVIVMMSAAAALWSRWSGI